MSFRKLIFTLIVSVYTLSLAAPFAWGAPAVTGSAAALIDSRSGMILWTKNADTPLPPASTTKIMTAILALENSKLTDTVKSGKNPTLVEPSAIGLKEGETILMENLLYSIMLKSANDAAVAIAEHISGSVPEFAALMNKKARELGAKNTNFANPNGLPDPNHRTTARDLALIAKYAMENPEFRKLVSTKVKTIPRADDTAIKWLQNHNKLLWRYEGAIGVKTGYTREAKQCLVAAAEKDGQEFIAVILGSEGSNIWNDAQNILEHAFASYSTALQKKANTPVRSLAVNKGIGNVELVTERDFYYTTGKGETAAISETVEIDENIMAPVKKGQVLGRTVFTMGGEQIGYVNLVAQNEVLVKEFSVVKGGPSPTNSLIAGAVLLVIFLAFNLRKRRRKYRNRGRLWINRDILK